MIVISDSTNTNENLVDRKQMDSANEEWNISTRVSIRKGN